MLRPGKSVYGASPHDEEARRFDQTTCLRADTAIAMARKNTKKADPCLTADE